MPNGFNFYVPVTNPNSASHYTYQPGTTLALSHIDVTHLSTPRGTTYGSWQFMPNTNLDPATVTAGSQISASNRKAAFRHENEQARAHYYWVQFDRDQDSPASGVRLEISPAQHSMMARITFPTSAAFNNLIFDCSFASGGLTFGEDNKSFTAYSDQVKSGSSRMYIYGEFSSEFDSAKVLNNKQGIINFPDDQTTITMKLATSFISQEQAKRNLELEIPDGTTFEQVYGNAQKTWDDLLGTVEIEGATTEQMTTFYSNLYRTYLYPTLYSENTGTNEEPAWKYASLHSSTLTNKDVKDGKVYIGNGFWDTFRTTWPAYALLTPSKSGEMLDGMLTLYEETGWLPHFLNPGNIDTDTGSQAEAVLADAAAKGIVFDYETAYQAVIKNANAVQSGNYALGGRKGQEEYPFRGYVGDTSTGQSVSSNEAVSWSLDNYLDDYAASRLALALGKTEEAAYLQNRSLQYAQIFSEEAGGFFMYKNLGGVFSNAAGLNPYQWLGAYCESNAWNSLFTLPHDVNGLANLLGGREALADKLDTFFNAELDLHRIPTLHEMREAREVRMGLLAFNTQPALQIPYLYDYAGQPYKTQALVREIMDRLYVGGDIGQGYIGDDDAGSLSAWYVFSALGFFPTAVGNPEYTIGSPLFKKATIHLENGKELVINAPENSKENIYVQGVKLNGQAYDKTYFTHADLTEGGVIDFDMGPAPSDWGTGEDAVPTSVTQGDAIQMAQQDLTRPDMQKRSDINLSLGEPIFMTDNTQERSKLIDNTSATETTLTGSGKEIWYYTPTPQVVSMYTLTSGSDPAAAPSAFTLYGSMDGKDWVQLDKRTEESFAYSQFTRPFLVAEEKRQPYSYFKLEIDGRADVLLAEFELLGSHTPAAVEDAIEALPDPADLDISHKRTVYAAREMYNILSPEDKALVSNRDDLEAAVEQMQALISAQPAPSSGFAAEIAAIVDRYDSSQRQHEIVFYGASNFRMWEDMETDLGEYKVQNHGFGGSSDKDLVAFAETALYPYQPEILFFQTGSNDYVGLSGTEDQIVQTCMAYKKYMFEMFHKQMPHTKFVVMSGLLLPGRSQYTALTQRINEALRAYCETVDYMYFVDASALTYDGTNYNNSLFISDGIHLNHEGQLRWCNEYIRPQIDAIVEEYDLYWLSTEDERQPDAPEGLAGVAPTLKGRSDGKITGVSAGMEWRASEGDAFTACTGDELTGLAAGVYTLRYAAADGKLPSESGDITVPEGADTLPRPDCQWTLDKQAGIVKDIPAGTTVEELVQGFGGSEWVTVTLNGETVTTGLVVTGMTVQYTDGQQESYTAAVQGDLDKDGSVSIADVMEACKIMARQAAGNDPTPLELACGNLDMDKEISIADVMELCKILARQA